MEIILSETTETKTVKTKYVTIDGERFDLRWLVGFMDELEDCDGFFTAVTIDGDYDGTLRKSVEKIGLASFNIRNGGKPGKNFSKIRKEIMKLDW